MASEEEPVRRPWKYTDDIVAILIVVAWIVGKFKGISIPDWVLGAVLGYVFGKYVRVTGE